MPKAAKTAVKKGDPFDAFLAHMSTHDKVMDMFRMSDDDLLSNVKGYISTQSIALNKAIGQPGIPRGRITEISGPEHTGKSTLLDHIFAEVQRLEGIAMLVDSETARDAKFTSRIGVNTEKLILPQPKGTKDAKFLTLEDVFNTVGTAVDWQMDNFPDLPMVIGVDSIAGLPTREDLERGAGEKKPGEAASIIKHTFRALTQKIAKSGVCLVFVNQLYSRIGYKGWGDPRIEYGGSGIPYFASLRIRLNPGGEKIKLTDGTIIGSCSEAKIQKSKVSGVTGAKCQIPILHGVGIDNTYSLFDGLKKEGYITNSGSWYNIQLPGAEEPLKWQKGHFGLAELCHQTPGLYDQLVATYNTIP